MKQDQKLWTRDELILAINLYCKLPFGKLHSRTKEVLELAAMIGRKPGAVAFKLVNFASLDPTLQQRGIKGATNTSKLDKEIWKEFYNNWDTALIESEKLLAQIKHTTIEDLNHVDKDEVWKEGLDKERLIKTRVNQNIFRTLVLATYNNTCCITGINHSELLVASHIVAWKDDTKNRLNPTNGLCLNALHDRAFDKHLITVDAEDYTLHISAKLKPKEVIESFDFNFMKLQGKQIHLPDKFLPSKEFLKKHNERFNDI